MIKVIENKSFTGYYEIHGEDMQVHEVQGRIKARRMAFKMAKKAGDVFISFLGSLIDVE